MRSESKMRIIAKTSYGLEEVLVEELKQIGVTEVELATRAVMFEGTKETLYKANLWLRSANRLIVPIKTFKIKSADDLYDKVKEIAWEDIFTVEQTFAIDSTVFSEIFSGAVNCAIYAILFALARVVAIAPELCKSTNALLIPVA